MFQMPAPIRGVSLQFDDAVRNFQLKFCIAVGVHKAKNRQFRNCAGHHFPALVRHAKGQRPRGRVIPGCTYIRNIVLCSPSLVRKPDLHFQNTARLRDLLISAFISSALLFSAIISLLYAQASPALRLRSRTRFTAVISANFCFKRL